ncbi:MAG: ROK family protein [Candidatus Pacearchaeota archaeon]|jgi:glucokinase
MKKEALAFDIGGTHMRVAIARGRKIYNYEKCSTPKNKILFLKKIEDLILKFDLKKIKGIGIGIAGPVKDGVVKNPPNLPLRNFDLKKYLEKKFKKKVKIKNDVECSTLAELKHGINAKNFILVAIGTGIGGGIIVNEKNYRGRGYGGEFGRMYVRDKKWEDLWKETCKKIKREFGEQKFLKDLVKMKSQRSEKILDEAADYIGEGIASLISAFDPEIVLIGGGIKNSGNLFLKKIKKSVLKYSTLPKKTPIRWTTLKHPGVLGASMLVD